MAKILIVEDDSIIREMLVRRLSRDGFQVIAATNGVQAIAIARAEQPNLILLALNLPILDGRQTSARLRANPETYTIPIIMLSCLASYHEHDPFSAATCDDFEPKPIDLSRLTAKVHLLANQEQRRIRYKHAV